jgi:hypothetical protein
MTSLRRASAVAARKVTPPLTLPHYTSKKESKAVPLHAMEAHRGRGGITPTHS